MKQFYLFCIFMTFANMSYALSKEYDEDLIIGIKDSEPCFYFEDSFYKDKQGIMLEYLTRVYEWKDGNAISLFFARSELNHVPLEPSTCLTLGDFNKEQITQFIWEENTPYMVSINNGTRYQGEFCLIDNKVVEVKVVPDPNHIKNAERICTDIEIKENVKVEKKGFWNVFFNWILNFFP